MSLITTDLVILMTLMDLIIGYLIVLIYPSIGDVHLKCVLHPGVVEVFVTFMAPMAVGPVTAVIHALKGPSALDIPLGRADAGKPLVGGGVYLDTGWLKCRNGCIELMGRPHFFKVGRGRLDDGFSTCWDVSFSGRTGGFIDGCLRHMMLFVGFRDTRFVIFIGAGGLRTVEGFLGGVFWNWADRDWDRRTLWIYGSDVIHTQFGKVDVGEMCCGWRFGRVWGICERGRRSREVAGICWMEAGNSVSTLK